MSKAPYMPLWVADFLAKTMDLDAKEIGAYMLLLMAMWSHGGTLPDDQKKLQRVARCGRDWPKIWDAIKHYFEAENGVISNRRLSEELQKVATKREVNAQSGARGGLAKALKNKEAALANATVSLKQPYPYSEREEKREAIASQEKTPKRRPEVPLPEGWVPSEANVAHAISKQFTMPEIEENAERFRNHHHAKGTRFRDWDAAWRTWIGNARSFGPSKARGPAIGSGHNVLFAGFQRAASGVN